MKFKDYEIKEISFNSDPEKGFQTGYNIEVVIFYDQEGIENSASVLLLYNPQNKQAYISRNGLIGLYTARHLVEFSNMLQDAVSAILKNIVEYLDKLISYQK